MQPQVGNLYSVWHLNTSKVAGSARTVFCFAIIVMLMQTLRTLADPYSAQTLAKRSRIYFRFSFHHFHHHLLISHSPPGSLRVAAQDPAESRQHIGSRINIAALRAIVIQLRSWPKEEEGGGPSDHNQSPGLMLSAATHPGSDRGFRGSSEFRAPVQFSDTQVTIDF